MRTTRRVALTVGCTIAAAAALTIAGVASAEAGSKPTVSSTASVPVVHPLPAAATRVISNCQTSNVKPAGIVATCADWNFRLRGLTWQRWASTTATGSGTAVVNTCKPNCAEGHFKDYQATIALSDVKSVGGQQLFAHLVVHFPGSSPWGEPTVHLTLPVRPL